MSGRGLYGQRPSACADASRRDSFADARGLSTREKMMLSLALGRDAGDWTKRYLTSAVWLKLEPAEREERRR